MADLRGVRVRNALLINPVLGLLVIRIVNLLRGVDRRVEVLKKVTEVVALAVEPYIVRVVRAELYVRMITLAE